jgi:hypothetical protein
VEPGLREDLDGGGEDAVAAGHDYSPDGTATRSAATIASRSAWL